MKESTSQQQVQLSPEEKLAYLRSHPRKIKTGMVRGKSVGSVIADIIIVLLVGALALVAIIPMWHVLMSSFSDGRSIFYYSGIAFVPEGGFTFRAYEELFSFEDGLIWTGYMNTILYVIGTLAVGLVLNVLAGYCLSRKTKLGGVMSALCVCSPSSSRQVRAPRSTSSICSGSRRPASPSSLRNARWACT